MSNGIVAPVVTIRPSRLLGILRWAARAGLLAALIAFLEALRRYHRLFDEENDKEKARTIGDLLRQGRNAAEKKGVQAEPFCSTVDSKRGKGEGNRKQAFEALAFELRACIRAGLEAVRHEELNCSGENLVGHVETQKGTKCEVIAYAAARFAQLRAMLGLADDFFWSSLCDADLQGRGALEGPGKGDNILWLSSNKCFVLKTITRRQLRTLLRMLDAYIGHLAAHKISFLSRFFGAFEIRVENESFLFVVQNCILGSRLEPDVVYSLKGTTENRWVNPRPGMMLKDLNFADKVIGMSDARYQGELLQAVRKDTRFLRDIGVVDYSICLGIHYCDGDSHPASELFAPIQGVMAPQAAFRGFEPKSQYTLVRDQGAWRVIYYIGIVDILERFSWQQVVDRGLCTIHLGKKGSGEIVTPHYYARRFKTSFCGKVQCFREPGDRVARFVRRLQTGIERGVIPRPTCATIRTGRASLSRQSFHGAMVAGQDQEVSIDESVDFAVRCGGHLQLFQPKPNCWWGSEFEEVEAFLDMDRHALVFQVMSRGLLQRQRRTSAIACYKIRRVYLSITCRRPYDQYCIACRAPIKVEAEPVETRRFTVEADAAPFHFTAPSRRQAKLWATALEVAAGYAEAIVEEQDDATPSLTTTKAHVLSNASTSTQPRPWVEGSGARARAAAMAAIMGSIDSYLTATDAKRVLVLARSAGLGMVECYLTGPEAERRWEKRRIKWIFGFVDVDGLGSLSLSKVQTLWCELNINDAEGRDVVSRFVQEERQGRRAGGGRQIGGTQHIHLGDFRRMLQRIDATYARSVYNCLTSSGAICCGNSADDFGRSGSGSLRHYTSTFQIVVPPGSDEYRYQDTISPEGLRRFFADVQRVTPAPTVKQVKRLLSHMQPPLVTRSRCLTPIGLANILCSPGNSLADPATRTIFQDMTRPLTEYYIDTSHNTYLEGNQLSSRSSVRRYVEVLRAGCRSVEVDAWDGSDGQPIVKHGYTVTTEVLFEDVIQAIADHAFVASEYPVIISIEQHCSALQRTRQGEILKKVLGDRLFLPPWDEQANEIDFEECEKISPWSARGRFLVKSVRGCCERCRSSLPAYDRCIALPNLKLSRREKNELQEDAPVESADPVDPVEGGRHSCHVSSMTAGKVMKLRDAAGEESFRAWNLKYLTRAYPEGTRIGSGNYDPLPLWECGVQMVALNYQTPDAGLLLNEGLFRGYNGSCGYVLKPPEHSGQMKKTRHDFRKTLKIRICCGHRLPHPEAPMANSDDGFESQTTRGWVPSRAVSCPMVTVTLEPGGQVSQTRAVQYDGYHPVFDHEAEFSVPDAPLCILMFEVRDEKTSRALARNAVQLNAVREGFRWLALRSPQGTSVPQGGLLVHAEFKSCSGTLRPCSL